MSGGGMDVTSFFITQVSVFDNFKKFLIVSGIVPYLTLISFNSLTYRMLNKIQVILQLHHLTQEKNPFQNF